MFRVSYVAGSKCCWSVAILSQHLWTSRYNKCTGHFFFKFFRQIYNLRRPIHYYVGRWIGTYDTDDRR